MVEAATAAAAATTATTAMATATTSTTPANNVDAGPDYDDDIEQPNNEIINSDGDVSILETGTGC